MNASFSFLDTFRALKQRVLWKFDDESLPGVPPNVMLRKWIPQSDILAHPNLVLFISHGGLFSTTESLYRGVPMLLIPFNGNQHKNAHRVQMEGYGKFIAFDDLTKDLLLTKIIEITSNDSFRSRAKQTSAVFQDNVVHPMNETIFWIEHVAKFKGTKHFKSHGVQLSWFSYLLFDVLIVNLIGIIIVGYTFYYLIKKIVQKFCVKRKSARIAREKRL